MKSVAEWIQKALNSKGNNELLAQIRQEVVKMCHSYPLYQS